MNKILIKFKILFLIIGLTSCTYSPIFSEKNYDFEITKINLKGDREVNRNIENRLNLIQSNNSEVKNKYYLEVISDKKRSIVSRDTKGDPLKFEMIISVQYKLSQDKLIKLNKEIKKNNIYNYESDQFKLEQNEKIILQNLSGSISDIIISSIINLDDN